MDDGETVSGIDLMTGGLVRKLASGKFVITAEMTPPDAASEAAVLERVAGLKGRVDAVNVTDGAGARAHMSAFAAAAILARNGIEPILQFTVRDRNRLALQGELIGAAALGIPNILCLHGDAIDKGDQPDAKAVHDIDSRALMALARTLRTEGKLPSGRVIEPRPRLLVGAADSPREPDEKFSTATLAGKIAAGADFFQTQFVYDPEMLRRYLARLRDDGILASAKFIIGVGPIASAKSARWMNANLFGVNVPEPVIARLEAANDPAREGILMCAELVAELRELPGVSGVHLMSPKGTGPLTEVLAELGT